jgi:hypothetical protein
MTPLTQLKLFTAAAALSLVGFGAGAPAHAEQPANNLGPVGPHEPIVIAAGTQRVLAFYEPERGGCAVSAVTWKEAAPDAPFRVRVSLKPGQMSACFAAPTLRRLPPWPPPS